jgi:HlyD family secretion protein
VPSRPIAAALWLLVLAGCTRESGDLRLIGTVERTLVELVAPVSEVLVAVHVQRGEAVPAGRVLVELDPTLARAEVARAEAVLAGARTRARVAESDLARLRTLRRDRVASEQDLERAELARDEAAAALREAEALLDAARKRERDLALEAPAAGVVDQLPFDPGERVPAGGVVAVLMTDADPWVRVWVPERSASRVVPGTRAEIRIDGISEPLRGSVLDVSREPEFTPHYALTERDRVHLVYETRVRILDPPGVLRPGLPAEVHLFPSGADGDEPS